MSTTTVRVPETTDFGSTSEDGGFLVIQLNDVGHARALAMLQNSAGRARARQSTYVGRAPEAGLPQHELIARILFELVYRNRLHVGEFRTALALAMDTNAGIGIGAAVYRVVTGLAQALPKTD